MKMNSASDIKKFLTSHGWMVYRTAADSVHLAELVRDNLVMEANVSVELGSSVRVRFVARAQRSDFPASSETEASLLDRARAMGAAGIPLGFLEVSTQVEVIPDPVDPNRVLDTWYEVFFEKDVDSDESLQRALTAAMGLEKVAPR